jgi:hypothetical protein
MGHDEPPIYRQKDSVFGRIAKTEKPTQQYSADFLDPSGGKIKSESFRFSCHD